MKLPVFEKYSCNARQFLSVHGDFLLLIGNDSFLILPGIQYSLIQKFRTQSQNIRNFAGFQQKNSVFTQNYHGFKKYQLQKKFIFWQLGGENAIINQNNNLFTQKRKQQQTNKKAHFKTISHEKSKILPIFDEMLAYLEKKLCI